MSSRGAAAALSRRVTPTPANVQKLGRKREPEWTETTELVDDDDDDLEECETFPQYWYVGVCWERVVVRETSL